MKKISAILLALIMMLSMVAMAAPEGELTGGKITITNPIDGETYNAYQLLYIESYDAQTNAYSYKANSQWATWLATQTAYVAIDAQGYVTWVEGADVEAFAKAAKNAIGTKSADASATANGTEAIEFTGLKLGYYLVDTTLGTLCSLNTTKPEVNMTEKNVPPTMVKKVQEDLNNEFGTQNDADMTQTVTFQSTITAGIGADSYVFHDTMDAGLTYVGVSGITLNGVAVDAANYTVNADPADDCTFDVEFTQAFCDTLKTNDSIVITYTATLNSNAVVAGVGNKNTATLTYGDNSETEESITTTYTWEFSVFKFTNVVTDTATTKTALPGASFQIKNGETVLKFDAVDGAAVPTYKYNPNGAVDTITTDANGKFTVQGLDSATYTLTETAAPTGYNKLASDITVVIEADGTVKVNNKALENKTVEVENKTGSELPETGGIGTTIFYTVGGLMMAAAIVLLVAKKKVAASK